MLSDLVSDAVAAGITADVICSDRSYFDPTRRYARREEARGVSIRRVPATSCGRRSRLGRVLDYATYLAGAAIASLRAERPDVVVGLSTPPIVGLLAVVIARLRGARSAYWVMDVYPDLAFALGAIRPHSLTGRLLDAASAFALRSADLVIALGETMAERLGRRGAQRLVTVHNWADGAAVRPQAHTQNVVRAARGWQDRFVILYSGNMGLAHEFDTVVEAATALRGDREVLFAFTAAGPRRTEVERAARERGLENLAFYEPVSRTALGPNLAAADLHLVTLRPGLEGLLVPSKIYGVLASGRPCLYIGPASGEVHEIIDRGACGTRVANGDAAAAVAAIRGYRDDARRRDVEGQRARQLFEREFSRERQTAALIRALRAPQPAG
jgi:glycosyltransferase involved in cell wall biosynthesis